MKTSTALATLLLGAAALATTAAPTAAGTLLKGEVLEVRDVEVYTYLRLKTADGEVWAAVNKAPVKKGAQVAIAQPMVMQNFESKSLKKTFDKIMFGNLADPSARPAAAITGAAPHGAMAVAPAAAPKIVKVDKASGADARTVADVVTGRAALKDQPVSVRAQVVKVNTGIMDKNWFHVQDGSGTAAAGTNDLLVTSKDQASIGDVVTIKGTVRTDVKLGAGYDYAVLVDGASLRK